MRCILVILNYNDAERSLNLAMKCKNYQSIDKIIIVNNGSTDNSLIFLKMNLLNEQNIILLNSEKNGGFAYGNNIAAKYISKNFSSKYVLFSNTDTIYSDESVEQCLRYLENIDDLALISMRIKNPNDIEEISCWNKRKYLDFFLANFYLYRTYINSPLNPTKIENTDFQFVEHVRGSFMLFKIDALVDIGFFDENTFLYFEEEIIAERLRKKDYKIGIVTNHFYIHDHLQSNSSNKLNTYFYESLCYYLNTYCNVGKVRIYFLKLAIWYKDFEIRFIIFNFKKIKNMIKNFLS